MRDLQMTILNKIGIDNTLHFLAGGWIACLGNKWYYAILIGFTIGLIKELFDKYIRKTRFDAIEWLATFSGSVITGIIMFLMKIIGG